MLYIIDTADVEAIRHINEFYPIAGVTTNPSIISREKTDLKKLLLTIREINGPDKMLHVQTTSKTAEEIVKEAKMLKNLLGDNFYIKVPIGEAGLKATMQLKKEGEIPVTMTTIFSASQALMAAKAGAAFVAPYVNRLDMANGNGVQVVADIVNTFAQYDDIDCKVLAASFKNVQQVSGAALCGCQSVTIAPDIFRALISHPLADIAVKQFDADWNACYGGKKVAELL